MSFTQLIRRTYASQADWDALLSKAASGLYVGFRKHFEDGTIPIFVNKTAVDYFNVILPKYTKEAKNLQDVYEVRIENEWEHIGMCLLICLSRKFGEINIIAWTLELKRSCTSRPSAQAFTKFAENAC